jgi:DNA-binding SARP family transcriptional activator
VLASNPVEEVECKVLGPLEIRRGGRLVPIPPRQRALLALLALRVGVVVPVDELLNELWGDEAPRTAKASLQNAVSRLRKALGANAIETSQSGYRLNPQAVAVDAMRFEWLVAAARSAEPAERAGLLRDALGCWRGAPLSELGVGWAEIARLEELHLTALEDRIETDLALGLAEELVPELEALLLRHFSRERLWAQLMRALYFVGRQAEALATYRRAHEAFVEELGVEPGSALKELQLAMLLQDHALEPGSHDSVELLARAAPLLPNRTYADRARTLFDHAEALWRLGERSQAKAVLERAEVEAGRAGDAALTELIRTTLAGHAWVGGGLRLSAYLRRIEEAVLFAEATGDKDVLAKLLVLQGSAQCLAGRAADGAVAFERAVEKSRATGDLWQEGWARNHLGLAWALGPMPVADALHRCEEQLVALEWGPPGPLGLWGALARLHSQLGAAEKAREFGYLAVDGARKAGLRFELVAALDWLASALEPFDQDEAEKQLRRARDLVLAAEEHPLGHVVIWAELARHAVRRNAIEGADALLAEARQRLRGDIVREHVTFHRAAGLVEVRKGNRPGGAELARRAVAFARKADNLHQLAGALQTLAELDPSAGALDEAEKVYEQRGESLSLARVRETGRVGS